MESKQYPATVRYVIRRVTRWRDVVKQLSREYRIGDDAIRNAIKANSRMERVPVVRVLARKEQS
jgi:hypothetical protein